MRKPTSIQPTVCIFCSSVFSAISVPTVPSITRWASSAVSNRNGWSSTAISGMKEVSTALEAVNMSMVPICAPSYMSLSLPSCPPANTCMVILPPVALFTSSAMARAPLWKLLPSGSTIPSLNVMASFSGFASGTESASVFTSETPAEVVSAFLPCPQAASIPAVNTVVNNTAIFFIIKFSFCFILFYLSCFFSGDTAFPCFIIS